ncbi:TolC family outer membrane protein [Marinobacter persicus]|uniref:Outer membrane protein n=1 Tax=Marinobacter persicus TaxID=930118 RepID=A0A2S6G469_9GAMM|nr:TolC family outer membrane protein [Marinobacter persicus]PPK51776.1 outer membrane protein [Marinobacter persicus]PPK53799.1 outer membrane protein [Marinobacter persicus]PPK58707.1 outer membrane protein [Marinobacter persicus]
MKKRLLPGLITLLAAQPAFSLDLMETYEQALSYDSGIASAKAQLEAQRAATDVTKSTLLPLLSAFAEGNHTDFESRNGIGDDSYRSLSYGVQLTQPVFRAENWFRFDASQFQTDAAEAQYNLAQQQLMLDVSTAYFNVLRAQDTVATAQATEAAIQRQYEQAQERFDVGLIAITEVYEARASYDDAKSQRIAAENQLNVAKEQLARLTGDYPEDLDNLRQNFPLARPEPMNPNAWEATALKQNWSIQAALYELNASEANLKVAKSGHLPTLDLEASYGETDYSGRSFASQGGEGTQAVIGLSLNVPLYSGGGTQAGVRQQRSLVIAAEQDLKTVKRDVQVNTRSLFLTVNNNIETANALKQTIVSRRSALDATLAGYDVGTRNIVEVLDAQRAYYVALRDYANARYDYVVNTLQLKQAAGTLSPEDLLELNNWLSEGARGIEVLANDKQTLDSPMQ